MQEAISEPAGQSPVPPEVQALLDQAYLQFNRPDFIENDPVLVPHRFSRKEDIEIAGFFAAMLAWGNRKTIIRNTLLLIKWMDNAPHELIQNFKGKDLVPFTRFVHRTFNGDDCIFFLHSLQNIYRHNKGLEHVFCGPTKAIDVRDGIMNFRKVFFEEPHLPRTEKHIANPAKNASAKRINMFLRWMVRKDDKGVDFGIWTKLRPSMLMCPLDVHTGNTSRKLGLLQRKHNDWKAVDELTKVLRSLDPVDPVKYDLALFGLGASHRL